MCAQRKAGRRQRARWRFACRLYPSHGPLRFITSHSFRARLCHAKNEAPEEEAVSKSKLLRLYSIVHVAMETTKTSHFTCQSKSFISIFFTCQVSACELQPFSCHDFANDICSQTVKTVFSHLKTFCFFLCPSRSS